MIDPRGLDVIRWTDAMAYSLNRYGYVNQLIDATAWQDWAVQVNQLPAITQKNPPDPYLYADWSIWAERFNMIVGLGD
ncbi:hypothetical protein UFOVP1204_21 [uncultured Caudovirales phage]|uniref:Uncharacterized protein n=1 Tax=uncultured Caudovirales phage TaxID=2100421 RepID=A0A6J5PWF9_9CAUD|nr:hypothetical protein UFOVP473_6 [uncultured Caudovirales phage]CAB4176173.1 hypothetical protein UFOVP983_6 [uncultured Caudovirales phage]CAB4189715.1 hypothetical protein UFOVP1204_21 [uncultured Caudovirales phage]